LWKGQDSEKGEYALFWKKLQNQQGKWGVLPESERGLEVKVPKAPRGRSHVSQHLDPAITILNILQFVGGSLVVYWTSQTPKRP